MSEFSENRWAVISERGAEGSGLTYAEAHGLVRRLTSEGLHGVAIITDEAAKRIRQIKPRPDSSSDRV